MSFTEMSIEELQEHKINLYDRNNMFMQQITSINKLILENNEQIDKIEFEIEIRTCLQEAKIMIDNDIKYLKGFELLSDNDLAIIVKRMDRTDYRDVDNYPRFIELKNMCKNVIAIKSNYPNSSLVDIVEDRTKFEELYPAKKFHIYNFQDEKGQELTGQVISEPFKLPYCD